MAAEIQYAGFTLNDASVCRPTLATEHARGKGFPVAWDGKANSVILPEGFTAGEAHFLILEKDFTVKPTGHSITIEHGDQSITLTDWTLDSVYACIPHRELNEETLLHVTLRDKRHLANLASSEDQYNLRMPDHIDYWEVTKNSGQPWTWQQIIQDLLDKTIIPGPFRFTDLDQLSEPPENLSLHGITVKEAMDFVLTIGMITCRYRVTDNALEFAPLDSEFQDTDDLLEKARDEKPVYLDHARHTEFHAAQLVVNFPDTLYQWQVDGATKEVTGGDMHRTRPIFRVDASTGIGVPGTKYPVWDPYNAIRDAAGVVENNTTLVGRAARLAQIYRAAATRDDLSDIFSGFYPFSPGNLLSHVAWYNLGSGLLTKVQHRPLERYEKDRQPDLVLLHRPYHRGIMVRNMSSPVSPGNDGVMRVYYRTNANWVDSQKDILVRNVNPGNIPINNNDWAYAEFNWQLRQFVTYCPIPEATT